MQALVTMIGLTFGRLTVLSMEGEVRHGKTRWLCQCRCGQQKIVIGKNLRNGNTQSCGCLRDETRQGYKRQIWS